jgi:hypothetical protein
MARTLAQLLEYLDGLRGRATLSDLVAELEELTIDAEEVAPFLRFSNRCYTRNLIRGGPWYNILALCWKNGQRSPIHDHIGSSCAVRVLRGWIETSGVPHALYTDWKNVYVRPPNAQEQVTGAVPRTQFGRMCAALDIRIIAASSPQAKGRVERNHGTHQDRLVKKLRRLGIADATAANAFLETSYLPEHNRRFAVAPTSAEDFHRRAPSRTSLDRVFQLEETRVLSNDWVVRYDTRYFQVARQSGQAPVRSTVVVREAANGAIEIRYRGRLMRWTEIAAPAPKPPAASGSAIRKKTPAGPAPSVRAAAGSVGAIASSAATAVRT